MKLLGIDTNAKTVKGQAKGYLTGILYLSPADLSGRNVCPMASAGCKAACLNTAGRGVMTNVQAARKAKTDFYFDDRPAFMAQLVKEIVALVKQAERKGLTPCVRLNGTSDIAFERVRVSKWESEAKPIADTLACLWTDISGLNIMELFPEVQFYDYTKVTKRALAHAHGEMPANYHLTFSLSEDNDGGAADVLAHGGNVAVVLKDYQRAIVGGAWTFHGFTYQAWDADESDLRFLDPKGGFAVLKAKGKARKDTSGFVR